MKSTRRTVNSALLFVAVLGSSAFAQDAPPPPLPLEPVEFPAYNQATLSNGARVLIVENHEQPVVTVNLRIKSGSAYDPEGKEGLAAATADMLNKGTSSRDARQIADPPIGRTRPGTWMSSG